MSQQTLLLNNKTYISSKRAAEICGYAKDYVGQLCRQGKVEAQLVGRNWYVSEDSIRRHKAEEGKQKRRQRVYAESSEPIRVAVSGDVVSDGTDQHVTEPTEQFSAEKKDETSSQIEQDEEVIEQHDAEETRHPTADVGGRPVEQNSSVHYEKDEAPLIPVVSKEKADTVASGEKEYEIEVSRHKESDFTDKKLKESQHVIRLLEHAEREAEKRSGILREDTRSEAAPKLKTSAQADEVQDYRQSQSTRKKGSHRAKGGGGAMLLAGKIAAGAVIILLILTLSSLSIAGVSTYSYSAGGDYAKDLKLKDTLASLGCVLSKRDCLGDLLR